jgi:radical SAM superfamily enzyme YgiQ (UPF0313 family)
MKITFIYPSVASTGFNPAGKDTLLRNIHHGLCCLSACAKQAGFETDLIDMGALGGWDDLRDKIAKDPVKVAAVTMMSPDVPWAMKAVAILKKADPRTVVIAGGIHPTIFPEETAANSDIDYVVRCEGEGAFVPLLRKIEAGESSDRVMTGSPVPMGELPWIDRRLFDCLEYPWDYFLHMPFFTIMAGRGCSYNCKFCAPASKMVHGRSSRRRTVKSVIGELAFLRDEFGMGSFMFHDDCLTEDKDWVMEFCDAYRAAGFRQRFVCQTRADIVCRHPAMIRGLARAGLRMAQIGFESGNDRVLKFINKGVTLKQNLEANRICRANGLRVFANYMIGLPTETKEEAADTFAMISRMRPYRASAAFFTPHPGSYLYEYCKEKALSLIDDHDDVVRLPEDDKPKIKGVDYGFLKRAVAASRKPTLESAVTAKVDKMFRNRFNRNFLRRFRRIASAHPGAHKLEILRMMKAGARYA